MASQIDATVPADNVQVEKSALRANFATAKAEITALQQQATLAYRMGIGQVPLDDNQN